MDPPIRKERAGASLAILERASAAAATFGSEMDGLAKAPGGDLMSGNRIPTH